MQKECAQALSRAGRFVACLIPGLLLAYAVMALVWPWSVQAPLNPWRAVAYFSHFFEKPWRELFAGELILVPDMPRSYVPTLFALQLPEIFLALGLSRPGGRCLRSGAARPAGAAARHFPLRRDGRRISHRAHGRAAAGHVQRYPAFRFRVAAAGRARRTCAGAWLFECVEPAISLRRRRRLPSSSALA